MMKPRDTESTESLEQIQQQFASSLFESDEAAVLMPMFRGDRALNARRFEGYRGNLFGTWCKSLTATYPVLRRQVGELFFEALSRDYGQAHPSAGGDLNFFGAHLADFLETFPPVRHYPWLPDLVDLEWHVHRAHYALDAPAVDAALIETLSPSELNELRVCLHPAVATLHSEWAIADIWIWHQSEAPGAWIHNLRKPATVVVSRPRWKVQVRAVDAAEAAGLNAIAKGESLGGALESAFAADPGVDVVQLFSRWLVERMLVAT